MHGIAYSYVYVCAILGISMNARKVIFTISNKNYLFLCRKTLMKNTILNLIYLGLLEALNKSRSMKPRLWVLSVFLLDYIFSYDPSTAVR